MSTALLRMRENPLLRMSKALRGNQSGFTLIEILITLAIFSLVAAVALPNLRNFNASQELDNGSSNLVQILKQARSSAVSGVRCHNVASLSWNVEFTSDKYRVFAKCTATEPQPSPTPTTEVKENPDNTPNFSEHVRMSSNICNDSKITIEFKHNSFKIICPDPLVAPQKFCMVLRDTRSLREKAIRMDSGGVVYADDENPSCS
jgi:prepilin-type N-terminal cleavage/methylation domain-containing protein